MKEKIQTIVTIVVATIVALPCIMIFNDNDSFIPNLIGLAYIFGLTAFCKCTRLGKWCAKKFEQATDKL